ncbi:trypsin-like peptidase domain-containing protein [Streptomyces sp. BK239]|uniref:trypsin-like peptidase domain-containing protein n=1 Tax=Streptomyces sp. BK239 TaxID=2512155 RepID=UPI0010D897DA|nr:trypsin-like peptidase domain-containing protein [Streptomyces sp. BK239]RZU10809.1 hypothetical protein EV567_5509 [Streptomyces sp. BK239]
MNERRPRPDETARPDDTGEPGESGVASGSGGVSPRSGASSRPGVSARPFLPPDRSLVRFRDPLGRPRGVGFLADHHGTVLTGHEVVDGLTPLVVEDADGRGHAVHPDAVTALPELGLALVHIEGLDGEPLPLTVRDHVEAGAYVRLTAGCWREARVLASAPATYIAAHGSRLLHGALELAIGTAGRDALRRGGGAAGGPVLDAATGAVVAVLGTALSTGHREAGFAVPLRPAPSDGPLADLLARNAATVPAYGADLNPAALLELTATSVGSDFLTAVPPVERPVIAREFADFTEGPAAVLALVGAPGSGRTTELAALAARRARDPRPAPTLWLRGADLREEDASIADAARRALTRAARIVTASRPVQGDPGELTPERLARLARSAGRPLLLLLDGPEEMPPAPADRLREWTDATAGWLREAGARLVVACRAEYWEEAGARYPAELLHGRTAPALPPCVLLGDLTPAEAREARARYGAPDAELTDADARHPLTLRLYAEVRAALPEAPGVPVDRDAVFAAYLDLVCLRVAVRLAAENGVRGTAVRLLAAKVAGQVHEAARRSLGPGQGALDRAAFEAVFPWGPAPARLGGGTGWASAVLAEGLFVPAGSGYRFAHEELADWVQGAHLDLDEALNVLVRGRGRRGSLGDTRPLPVPHHRIGPVVQALLLLARHHGPRRLSDTLGELTSALRADPDAWWAARLLAETLRGVHDAMPYLGVLRPLADLVARWPWRGRSGGPTGGAGPWGRAAEPPSASCERPGASCEPPSEFAPDFWAALALPVDARLDLLRRLVVADAAPHAADAPRYLDAVARLLTADPLAVQPQLTLWFDDERPLPATPHATVATAAQALLHTHRHTAPDDLVELLADRAHARADELLAVLAEEEPSALCRAVHRWAHDERPVRRVAATAYALRVAPHARTAADRELLRDAARALLTRPADPAPAPHEEAVVRRHGALTPHEGALALLHALADAGAPALSRRVTARAALENGPPSVVSPCDAPSVRGPSHSTHADAGRGHPAWHS